MFSILKRMGRHKHLVLSYPPKCVAFPVKIPNFFAATETFHTCKKHLEMQLIPIRMSEQQRKETC